MTGLASLSVEELADGICLRAGRIAAGQAELLLWVAEFDRREGWAGPGMLTCAHWLSWRLGLSPGAAREQVRVARRLEELPEIAAAFGDGRVSYSKVRAITRAAEPDDGVDWVDLARHSSGAQLEKLVRGIRRARANEQAEVDPEAAAWQLRTRVRYDDRGNFTMTISGPAEQLPVLQAGIEAKKAELQRERDAAPAAAATAGEVAPAAAPAAASKDATAGAAPSDVPAGTPEPAPDDATGGAEKTRMRTAMESFWALQDSLGRESAAIDDADHVVAPHRPRAPAQAAPVGVPAATPAPAGAATHPPATQPATVTDAEALLALAQDALAAEKRAHPDLARRRGPQLTTQVDPLSGWARQSDGELLPPSSLHAVLKTLPGRGGRLRLRPLTDVDLRRFDLSRDSREISPALRELLATLDGERCRFPGCTRHRKLHAHHVRYWRDGGPTDLANLVLVCSRHHTLIHTAGFQLVLHPDRQLQVRTADGVPVLHHPAQPWGDPADLATGRGHDVTAQTLPPDHCTTRLDLGYAVSVLRQQAA